MKILNNQEFEVLIQTDFGDFISFLYPYDLKSNLKIDIIELHTLYAKNIFLNYNQEYLIQKTEEGYFSYKVTGKYIGNNKIQIDNCFFILDSPVPKDIEIGQFVSFEFLKSDCIISN